MSFPSLSRGCHRHIAKLNQLPIGVFERSNAALRATWPDEYEKRLLTRNSYSCRFATTWTIILLWESAPSRRSPVIWKSITSLVLAALTIVTLVGSMDAQDATYTQDSTTVKTILSFGTMIGDPGTGTTADKARNVIRGYGGPDSPWLIQSAQGTLKTNGSLTVTQRTRASRRDEPGPLLPRRTQLAGSHQLD
jgi:hypothetical protein